MRFVKHKYVLLAVSLLFLGLFGFGLASPVQADHITDSQCEALVDNKAREDCFKHNEDTRDHSAPTDEPIKLGTGKQENQCGKGDKAVKTSFNFGCRGDSY